MFNNKLYVYGDQDVQVPAHLNFGKFILNHILRMGDAVALENAESGEKITYKELAEYAVKLSVGLTNLGVKKGDIVALGSEKRLLFVPTALAIIFSGATYTPYDFKSGRAHLQHKMKITQPKYFICSELFWETNREVLEGFESVKTFISLDNSPKKVSVSSLTCDWAAVDVEQFEPTAVEGQVDTAFVLYSSGTTGMPKGVKLSHLNCILNSLSHDFKDSSLKTAYVTGDWFHNYDSFMTYKMLGLGVKIIYTTEVTPEIVAKALEKHQVNIAFLVPSVVSWLSKIDEADHYNLDSLKVVYCRSSPLHVKTMAKLKQRFPSIKHVLQGYGMTEAGELTSENWGAKGPRPGSVGAPSPGITLKVEHPETRQILGPNEHGEISLRGPVFMAGYIDVDPSTYLDDQGFFRTGDLGYYDEDGYFYVIDRLKEMIIHDGYKVAPLELETILLLHPGVREAGVVGKPDPEFTELPTAFVVRQPGSSVTEQELIDFVADEVSPHMQLKGGIKFIKELPRNPRGKILRRCLREMLNEI
ncbi:luciferin 4-monooxygenase-like [Pectinophora gossypiella]|uniref:luciferin 4-monooxygenase-like n=1 Tax=Pectinophora gossypiella TaxID=13191 RepID=UPI00214E8015|nr:luciferin 4-monooxygenase-like [Pectinophora gossypiella]